MSKIDAQSIAIFLDESLIGKNINVCEVVSLNNLKSNSISFISGFTYKDDINKKALIIVNKSFEIAKNAKNSYIKVENPRLAFAKVVERFFYELKKPSISKSAYIEDNTEIGNNIFIGENVIIESGCKIGDNTVIDHNAVILKNCKMGKF